MNSAKLLHGVEGFIAFLASGNGNPFSLRKVDGTVADHREPTRRRNGEPEATPEQRYVESIPLKRSKAFQALACSRGVRYAGCTVDNFEANTDEKRAAANQAREFISDMEARLRSGVGGLVIAGPVGTGKDHLLFAVMREAILTYGYSVQWCDGLQLFSRVKQAVGEKSSEQFIASMVKPQILALSDPVPPKGELTDYESSVLRDMVDRRYANGLPTWVTTNVTDRQDGDRLLSSAVMDRLKDGAEVINCNWTSYRRVVNKGGNQ